MSSPEDETDKSFEATPQKLLEARKKGEIARSTELLTAASYAGFLVAILLSGESGLNQLGAALAVIIGQSAQIAPLFFDGAGTVPAGGIIKSTSAALLPIFVYPALAVLLVLFATKGIVFAPTKIQPKLSKISLISNAKNKYGRTGLFQFTLSFSKLIIYSSILAVFLYYRTSEMVAALHTTPQHTVILLGKICVEFLTYVVIVSAIIGGIDAMWQHFEHLRKNKMSRKEVMDETKNSEGDPYMKQERRQRAQTLAGSQVAVEVAAADVVIVNPTHYAVALKWDRQPGQAPVCVAKGLDEAALRIREIATQNSVPIHSDPPAARSLHATTNVGDQIAPEHYKAVAAAIRFAESMRERAKGKVF